MCNWTRGSSVMSTYPKNTIIKTKIQLLSLMQTFHLNHQTQNGLQTKRRKTCEEPDNVHLFSTIFRAMCSFCLSRFEVSVFFVVRKYFYKSALVSNGITNKLQTAQSSVAFQLSQVTAKCKLNATKNEAC